MGNQQRQSRKRRTRSPCSRAAATLKARLPHSPCWLTYTFSTETLQKQGSLERKAYTFSSRLAMQTVKTWPGQRSSALTRSKERSGSSRRASSRCATSGRCSSGRCSRVEDSNGPHRREQWRRLPRALQAEDTKEDH